jgi:hypothetical protein
MVLYATASRSNRPRRDGEFEGCRDSLDLMMGYTVSRLQEPRRRETINTRPFSDTNFPRWKSRFARSSGYLPERDGPVAPALPPRQTRPAQDQDAIQSDPAAAGAGL